MKSFILLQFPEHSCPFYLLQFFIRSLTNFYCTFYKGIISIRQCILFSVKQILIFQSNLLIFTLTLFLLPTSRPCSCPRISVIGYSLMPIFEVDWFSRLNCISIHWLLSFCFVVVVQHRNLLCALELCVLCHKCVNEENVRYTKKDMEVFTSPKVKNIKNIFTINIFKLLKIA